MNAFGIGLVDSVMALGTRPGDIRASLREAKIGYKGITRTDNGVTVRLSDIADQARARTALQTLQQPQTVLLLLSMNKSWSTVCQHRCLLK